MDDLITWLRAQLDDDAAAAEEMKKVFPTPWELADRGWMARIVADGPHFHEVVRLDQKQAPGVGELDSAIRHVLLQDPDRVLREVESKRAVIREWEMNQGGGYPNFEGGYATALEAVIAIIAAPYSDRPGYQEEWKP